MKYRVVLIVTIVLLAASLFMAGMLFSLYQQKQAELEELKDSLDLERERNDDLAAEVEQLKAALAELRQEYMELIRKLDSKREQGEKEESGDPAGSGPGSDYPGGSGPTAYLTIDDGPSQNTIPILDILKQYGVPATFFATGNNVTGSNDIYNRIVAEGHVLGNHTYTHHFETIYQSADRFMEDLVLMEEFLYRETGVRTNLMRFPGGSSSQMAQEVSGYNIIVKDLIKMVTARGYDYFDWNVSTGDADTSLTPEELVENVRNSRNLGYNLVILMHDGRNNRATVEALPKIIELLDGMGYNFDSLKPGVLEVKHRKISE